MRCSTRPTTKPARCRWWRTRCSCCGTSGPGTGCPVKYLHDAGGLAGMLSSQADALLARIERELGAKGAQRRAGVAAGPDPHQRPGAPHAPAYQPGRAVMVAGAATTKLGSASCNCSPASAADALGRQRRAAAGHRHCGPGADLIHETLIRTRGWDAQTGKPLPTGLRCNDHIEANPRPRPAAPAACAAGQARRRQRRIWPLAEIAPAWGITGAPMAAAIRAAWRRASCAGAAASPRSRVARCWYCWAALRCCLRLWWIARMKIRLSSRFSYAVHHALWRLGRRPVPEFVV